MSVVLRVASVVLPRGHRARWREEVAAVLMDVSGWRRFRYTVDTVVKVPVLAVHHRSAGLVGGKGRRLSALVGAALIASVLATLSGSPRALPGGSLRDPVGYLLAMGGLAALVAVRSFRTARRRSGARLGYADSGAVVITILAGAGPLVGGLVSWALYLPVLAMVGNVLPGLWLATVCGTALLRRTGPWPLAAIGTVAGLAMVAALGLALPLAKMTPHAAMLIGEVSILVAAPAFLVWSAWAGVRLLLGHQELATGR
jgi:hypothetical protein